MNSLSPSTMKQSKNYFTFFFLLIFSIIGLTGFAHFGSKGPYGGTVSYSTVYDSTVYIGTANGGVYESTTSKLVAWRARPVGFKSGKITAITHSGTYLFAATADSGVYIFTGYVGSDRYWQKINTGLGNLKIKSLIAIDSITVLAGTDGGGVYKTTNKGVSWTAISNSTLNNAVITGFAKAGNQLFLTASDNGIFTSADNGATWTDFNDASTLNIAGTTTLSFNQTSNELVVINNNGVFKTAIASSNPVAAYTAIVTGLPANTVIRSVSNNGSLWFLATDKGVFASMASAINWTALNTGLPTINVNTVVPFQTTLVAGTAVEGIFKASISSPSWVENNFGFNNLATYAMVCSGVTFIATANEKGVFVSKDLASPYKKSNKGLTDSLNVTDLVLFGTKLLASTKNAGVFVSTDSGANWTPLNSGLNSLTITKLIASSSYVYLFDAAGEVYVSQGTNWTSVQTGLPTGVQPSSLVFYNDKVALGTLGDGVYTAIAGTAPWTAFNTGLSDLNVTSVAAQSSRLFAGTDGNGVFVSDTAASNWTATAVTTIPHTTMIGLNENKIQALGTYAGYVFASYKGGLVATSDFGQTWIPGGNQFNLPSYTNVYKIDFVTTRVFVTTEHNTLYSNALSELPTVGITERNNNVGNFIIYPNPSDGILNIDLKNITGRVTQMHIYDQRGKKVTTVPSSSSLNQTLQLKVAPGIYHIQVVTEKGTAIQKVVIQ